MAATVTVVDMGLAVTVVGCVMLMIVLLGCLIGLLVVRWMRTSSSNSCCNADDEENKDCSDVSETRRIVTHNGTETDTASPSGWLRRIFRRATSSAKHDRCADVYTQVSSIVDVVIIYETSG